MAHLCINLKNNFEPIPSKVLCDSWRNHRTKSLQKWRSFLLDFRVTLGLRTRKSTRSGGCILRIVKVVVVVGGTPPPNTKQKPFLSLQFLFLHLPPQLNLFSEYTHVHPQTTEYLKKIPQNYGMHISNATFAEIISSLFKTEIPPYLQHPYPTSNLSIHWFSKG